MQTLLVPLGEREYPIYIGKNMWQDLPLYLQKQIKSTQVMLVSDENVYALYGQRTTDLLQDAGMDVLPVIVPPGENSKTMARADDLYTAAIKAGLDRTGAIFALGGGVVGDLAGFVAATYLRGVSFVQMPTTLLSQVDSSVGGKTAVNHKLGKNLIGAFYQPRLVWIELETIDTLPEREFFAGAAEVVKYGIILSENFFSYLENNWDAFLGKDVDALTHAVAESCDLKARIVAVDEQEKGLRAILNFGHTLGHALEAATSFNYYLHGEAVQVGMVLAVHLAALRKILSPINAKRMLELLARIGLKEAPVNLASEAVLQALQYDKKREGQEQIFILPESIGVVNTYRDVNKDLIAQVLKSYLTPGQEGSLFTLAD